MTKLSWRFGAMIATSTAAAAARLAEKEERPVADFEVSNGRDELATGE